MFAFLIKRPSSLEWDEYLKKNTFLTLLFSTLIAYLIMHNLYDLYAPYFTYLVIMSIGVGLAYLLRKSVAGKIFIILVLLYFAYQESDTFIAILNFLQDDENENRIFSYWSLLLLNFAVTLFLMIRMLILLFADYDEKTEDSNLNLMKYDSLLKLKTLYDSGVLSEEEFEFEKRKILK